MHKYLDGRQLDDVAIERIRCFEPEALEMDPAGYWLGFSGGKDSIVILDLATRADVAYEPIYNLCGGCDPPEVIIFVKHNYPDVRFKAPAETMWQLVRRKGLPPRRNARFCCEIFKETGGRGRLVMTGVRWAESTRRSKRRMVEACYRDKTRRFLHPIIDWSTSAVWQYIRERHLAYCSLYDEGFTRIGCVLCPCIERVERDIARWPKIAAKWEAAVKATYNPDYPGWKGIKERWHSAEEYWQWWLDRRRGSRLPQEPTLFEA